MTDKIIPDIGFEYMDIIPSSFLDEFREAIYRDDLTHKEITRPSDTVFMSIEWAIPTAIVLYISKSYFDTFLAEMAKDHYKILKNSISKLANKSKDSINISLVSTGDKKLSKERIFTTSFSVIYIVDNSRLSFKFLFRQSATENQIKEATNYFLDLIKDLNDNKENSRIYNILKKAERISSPIIICYNEKEREAMILRPEQKITLSDIANIEHRDQS